MNTSANGALVMYLFVPEITHSSPSRRAVVANPDGSDPAPSSVSANDATHSPEAIFGRYAFFCSSVAPSSRTCPAIPLFVPNIDRNDGVV